MKAWNSKLLIYFSIIIPNGNLKDIQKIPEELRKNVNFYPVKNLQ